MVLWLKKPWHYPGLLRSEGPSTTVQALIDTIRARKRRSRLRTKARFHQADGRRADDVAPG